MGVRTKTVKKSARVIVEKYYSRLGVDFHTNKRICDEVAVVPSKRMRNSCIFRLEWIAMNYSMITMTPFLDGEQLLETWTLKIDAL